VKVFPDLTALTKDALALARANEDDARRRVPQRSEGREFESLREYRVGDDRRSIDWKASARRSRTMVRVHQPERNQVVLLMIDCGRHMAGEVHGPEEDRSRGRRGVAGGEGVARSGRSRRRHGVRDRGEDVAASAQRRRAAPRDRQALYRVDASLEESDVGAALDVAFARQHRRSLVVVLTDLLDADSSLALVRRSLRLVPRHFLLVAALVDDELRAAALDVPRTPASAYERLGASRLEAETSGVVASCEMPARTWCARPRARLAPRPCRPTSTSRTAACCSWQVAAFQLLPGQMCMG
jgi:uncharacterized protein (DUF58 family)